jgi:Host cell surface-exposed lipoprotein
MKTIRASVVGLVLVAALATSVSTAYAVTAGEANAVRSAQEYLQTQAFSLKGLISQLKFSGFSTKSATYGAEHSGANWYKQAVKSAHEYLQTQGFSYRGLVSQLEFSGFTPSQAAHGAKAAGL